MVHGRAREPREVVQPRVAHPHDHRHPAVHPGQHVAGEGLLLGVGELRRLAHHAEHGHAVHALGEVEIQQPVGARVVDGAVVAKGRCRDHVDAVGALGEPLGRHDPPLRSSETGRGYCLAREI